MEKFKQWIVAHKLVSIIVASILVVAIALAIVLPLTLSNKHTFSEEWSVNSEYHWHACTDENCNAKANKSKHSFEDGKCTVCQKKNLGLTITIGNIESDTVSFQRDWISCDDEDDTYKDTATYGYEYFKIVNGNSTSIGEDFPTEAGSYQVKVIFDGDETYLPAEVTANFTIE